MSGAAIRWNFFPLAFAGRLCQSWSLSLKYLLKYNPATTPLAWQVRGFFFFKIPFKIQSFAGPGEAGGGQGGPVIFQRIAPPDNGYLSADCASSCISFPIRCPAQRSVGYSPIPGCAHHKIKAGTASTFDYASAFFKIPAKIQAHHPLSGAAIRWNFFPLAFAGRLCHSWSLLPLKYLLKYKLSRYPAPGEAGGGQGGPVIFQRIAPPDNGCLSEDCASSCISFPIRCPAQRSVGYSPIPGCAHQKIKAGTASTFDYAPAARLARASARFRSTGLRSIK